MVKRDDCLGRKQTQEEQTRGADVSPCYCNLFEVVCRSRLLVNMYLHHSLLSFSVAALIGGTVTAGVCLRLPGRLRADRPSHRVSGRKGFAGSSFRSDPSGVRRPGVISAPRQAWGCWCSGPVGVLASLAGFWCRSSRRDDDLRPPAARQRRLSLAPVKAAGQIVSSADAPCPIQSSCLCSCFLSHPPPVH